MSSLTFSLSKDNALLYDCGVCMLILVPVCPLSSPFGKLRQSFIYSVQCDDLWGQYRILHQQLRKFGWISTSRIYFLISNFNLHIHFIKFSVVSSSDHSVTSSHWNTLKFESFLWTLVILLCTNIWLLEMFLWIEVLTSYIAIVLHHLVKHFQFSQSTTFWNCCAISPSSHSHCCTV